MSEVSEVNAGLREEKKVATRGHNWRQSGISYDFISWLETFTRKI